MNKLTTFFSVFALIFGQISAMYSKGWDVNDDLFGTPNDANDSLFGTLNIANSGYTLNEQLSFNKAPVEQQSLQSTISIEVFNVNKVVIIQHLKNGKKKTEVNIGSISNETKGYLSALSCSIENNAGIGYFADMPEFILETEVQGNMLYFDMTITGLLRENGVQNSQDAKKAVRRFFDSIKASTLRIKQTTGGRTDLIIP